MCYKRESSVSWSVHLMNMHFFLSLVCVCVCFKKLLQRFPPHSSPLGSLYSLTSPTHLDHTVWVFPGCKYPVWPLHVQSCWVHSLREGTAAGMRAREGDWDPPRQDRGRLQLLSAGSTMWVNSGDSARLAGLASTYWSRQRAVVSPWAGWGGDVKDVLV